ncbi:hypothetical protein BCR33DRAFT_682 [Rhizoclosmatium globosum]|uniref:F-box domain-containing protein n=1 Tax=Rhizoclosmatium globosum TaxID=329046 RepID=A0A1Y2D2V9_9FUNG|nr:hypothetical protein BCR33DRAFT_682 [Rhizoclosmatium globosum]|eukprot:ORY53446.1 hypothetical protein BCR33DRAFT_682 [Rhizoclosmatium globosum]
MAEMNQMISRSRNDGLSHKYPESSTVHSSIQLRRSISFSLSCFPAEVIDLIVSYLDTESILPFCHTIRHLLPLSETIFKVGRAFGVPIDEIWPAFNFPMSKPPPLIAGQEDDDEEEAEEFIPQPIEIPVEHIDAVKSLIVYLNRYGGSAHIKPTTPEYLSNIIPLAPRRVSLSLSLISTGPTPPLTTQQTISLLEKLSIFENVHITRFTITEHDPSLLPHLARALTQFARVERFRCFGRLAPTLIPVLPKINGFTSFKLFKVDDFPVNVLKECEDLERLSLVVARSFSVEFVRDLIGVLSACRKLRWVMIPNWYEGANADEVERALEAIGWNLERDVYNFVFHKDGAP